MKLAPAFNDYPSVFWQNADISFCSSYGFMILIRNCFVVVLFKVYGCERHITENLRSVVFVCVGRLE